MDRRICSGGWNTWKLKCKSFPGWSENMPKIWIDWSASLPKIAKPFDSNFYGNITRRYVRVSTCVTQIPKSDSTPDTSDGRIPTPVSVTTDHKPNCSFLVGVD